VEPFDDDLDAEGEVVLEHEGLGEHEVVVAEHELTITVLGATTRQAGEVITYPEEVVDGDEEEEEAIGDSEEAALESGEAIESLTNQAYHHPDVETLTTASLAVFSPSFYADIICCRRTSATLNNC
jgi:hypothetical protein